jgi:hypothetical protein
MPEKAVGRVPPRKGAQYLYALSRGIVVRLPAEGHAQSESNLPSGGAFRFAVPSSYAAFTAPFRWRWAGRTLIFTNSRKMAKSGASLNTRTLTDESETQLPKVLKSEGESMICVYDFGDNWCHEVMLEKVIPVNAVVRTPICLEGARRCPPEDVGGVSGFEEFLKAAFDPRHEHFEMLIH